MTTSKSNILRLLEAEALRHRAQARLAPELGGHHLEVAQALEEAMEIIKGGEERGRQKEQTH